VHVGVDAAKFVSGIPFGDSMREYVLFNRSRNEASLRSSGPSSWTVHTMTAVQSSSTAVPFRGIFHLKDGTDGGKIDAEWLQGAELAILTSIGGPAERQHIDFGEVQMPSSL